MKNFCSEINREKKKKLALAHAHTHVKQKNTRDETQSLTVSDDGIEQRIRFK